VSLLGDRVFFVPETRMPRRCDDYVGDGSFDLDNVSPLGDGPLEDTAIGFVG
jgi:hypothetical protein